MWGKVKQQWGFAAFLSAVGLVECIVVVLYLSVHIVSPTHQPKSYVTNRAILGISVPESLPSIEARQPAFSELWTVLVMEGLFCFMISLSIGTSCYSCNPRANGTGLSASDAIANE